MASIIYKKYFRSMSNVLFSQLLFEVTSFSICSELIESVSVESHILHLVPQEATIKCGQPDPKAFKRSS